MTESAASAGQAGGVAARLGARMGAWSALLLLTLVASALSPQFLTIRNLTNIVNQSAPLAFIAIGQTFVLLVAGIDLSVGSTVSLVSVATGLWMLGRDAMIPVVLLADLGLGACVGLANGLLIAWRRLPDFIVTLGMLIFLQGVNLAWTKGGPNSDLAPHFRLLSEGRVGPFPVAVFWLAGAAVLAWGLAGRTTFGRAIYAVGGNRAAARLAGVNVNLVRVLTYVISGVCAAMAGAFLTARVGEGQTWVGRGMELDSIAAAVMGGTSLFGGRGTIGGSVAATFILLVLYNILLLKGQSYQVQFVVKGLVIITSVALYTRFRAIRA